MEFYFIKFGQFLNNKVARRILKQNLRFIISKVN